MAGYAYQPNRGEEFEWKISANAWFLEDRGVSVTRTPGGKRGPFTNRLGYRADGDVIPTLKITVWP